MKTVGECMKKNVVSISSTARVRDALRLCIKHHIGTLPVVNEDQCLTGIVRLTDLISLGMPDFVHLMDHLDFVHDFGAVEQQIPNQDVLDAPLSGILGESISVEEKAGLLRAAALLHKNNLSDLPVVNAGGKLVGIASHTDVGLALMYSWLNSPLE